MISECNKRQNVFLSLFILFKHRFPFCEFYFWQDFFHQVVWVASSLQAFFKFWNISSKVAFEELVHRSLRASPFTNPILKLGVAKCVLYIKDRLFLESFAFVYNCIQKCSLNVWDFSREFDCRMMRVGLFDELYNIWFADVSFRENISPM